MHFHRRIINLAKRLALEPLQERWYSRRQSRLNVDLSFTAASDSYPARNDIHSYMHHYFHHLLPMRLKRHRAYFRTEQRGFGEDAFHAMWWLLMREFKPHHCFEIGIYRGQVISLWALIAQEIGFDCDVHGISPFTALGDRVSAYSTEIDYLNDTLNSFRIWRLPAPLLVKAHSSDPEAKSHIRSQLWDLIYIDGSHDYEVVLEDYLICRDQLNLGGLLVLDDASLCTSYNPPLFSFAGHPGPSRVAAEYAMKELRLVGAVGHLNVFMKE